MPQTWMILFDNTLYMQNQDYLPSRFILEKEATMSIVNSLLTQNENSVGIAPLAQPDHNYILTPTSNKPNVDTFISKIRLDGNLQLNKAFLRSKIALMNASESDKRMLLFFGADIEGIDFDRMLVDLVRNIKMIVEALVKIAIVLFGEKAEMLRDLLSSEMDSNVCEVITIGKDDNFFAGAMSVFGMNISEAEDDPELAMALRLSLAESNRTSGE